MKFAELKPTVWSKATIPGGFEISFQCPRCGNRFAINIHPGPADITVPVWHFHFTRGCVWEDVTIEPSIQDHHLKRTPQGDLRCPVHFSVTAGEVVLN